MYMYMYASVSAGSRCSPRQYPHGNHAQVIHSNDSPSLDKQPHHKEALSHPLHTQYSYTRGLACILVYMPQ